jgi:hypothetical protein
MVRRTVPVFLSLMIAGGAQARPRPQLTPQAAALWKSGFFLVADDNLAVPLDGKSKPVPFLAPAPERLEAVSGSPDLFVIDGDLYRRKDAALALVARGMGRLPAASSDGNLVASVDDKRDLKLTGPDGNHKKVPYRRPGNWELERPWVAPDGSWILAALKDYTQPLDAYVFLVVDPKTLAVDEVNLSKNFVPGELRQALSATKVALQMLVQETDEAGFARLVPSDVVVFDAKTKKLGAPPVGMKPGRPSPDGQLSLLEGKMFYSDDKSCGADETMLYEGDKHSSYHAGDGQVVSVLDFLPDNSGLIANVLSLKGCKNKGVIIPVKGGENQKLWKPFPLPVHPGHLVGRVYKQ